MKSPLNEERSIWNPNPSNSNEPSLSSCASHLRYHPIAFPFFLDSLCRNTRPILCYMAFAFTMPPCVLKSYHHNTQLDRAPFPPLCPSTSPLVLSILAGIWLVLSSCLTGLQNVFLCTFLRGGNSSRSLVLFYS